MLTAGVLVTGLLAACGGAAAGGPDGTGGVGVVRIGYFPTLTHAPALVAEREGYLRDRLGPGVTTQSFAAGPGVIQAVFSGSLDIAYLGPNPTITAYVQSGGAAIRVIAGATSGGASLVVRRELDDPGDLRGRTLATPQLGNTQDVALRNWLSRNGMRADTEGGGDVRIVPQRNAAALQAFVSGHIDGAWVPEPYATQFVDRGARVLVDERSLWDGGRFVTTNVIVRTAFLDEHPDRVAAFLEAHLDALRLLADDPARAKADVVAQLRTLTGQDLDPAVVDRAWDNLTFLADPLPATLIRSAEHAHAVGLLEDLPADDLAGLWDLDPLNRALRARDLPEVTP